ncbi:MAG: hypothetical protein PWQ87_800, partial [Candidatus Woesearchaeota archaeon]|nr:hypothetical protein [Candidatus Woesearchaeota archaeon]
MVGYYSTSDPWNPEVKRKDNIEGDLSISR